MSFFIKSLKMLDIHDSGFSFIIDELYQARQVVFVKEREFYLHIRANVRYISMEDFCFHSLHHH
jgi:hypothetical protein